jgi:hypothetical protein
MRMIILLQNLKKLLGMISWEKNWDFKWLWRFFRLLLSIIIQVHLKCWNHLLAKFSWLNSFLLLYIKISLGFVILFFKGCQLSNCLIINLLIPCRILSN